MVCKGRHGLKVVEVDQNVARMVKKEVIMDYI